MSEHELVVEKQRHFEARLRSIEENLRTAADTVADIRKGKYHSVVHPITGKRRASAGARRVHQAFDEALRYSDLAYLHQVAADLDMLQFPQTQEM